MKLARNLFLGLVFLVLLYGGLYRVFLRERVRRAMIYGVGGLPGFEKRWHKFFAPAGELDLRLTLDRPAREYLRGHWINAATGDFVTIAGNDTCTFQLGGFRYSGKGTFGRPSQCYLVEFQDGSRTRYFSLQGYDPKGSGKSHGIATAGTWLKPQPPFMTEIGESYDTKLTRAPARPPSPAP